jgi:sugar lactone lactonase YvrE
VRIRGCRLALLLAGFLTGCGGGGGSGAPAASPGAARGTTAVTVRIDVPLTGAASTRRPAYVSPATQSLAIAVETSGGQTIGTFSVNITPASTACQTVTVAGTATLTCSLSVSLALPASGTYTLATATFDQPQTQPCSPAGTPRCAGNVLSAALISATLQLNTANVVSIALGGLAAGFTVAPVANGFVQGNVTGLHVWGPQAQTLIVGALDADGYTIVGSGAPAIALSAASPSVQITTAAPGTFTIAATVSNSPAVVTPGTVPLTLVATPVGSPAQPYSQTVPLTISHTTVFVSDIANVLVFFDGNTTSSVTLAMTNNPRGVAVDANGNVYVANHGNGTVSECTAAGNYAPAGCTVPIAGLGGPEGVAIDGTGNLWEGDSGSGNIIEFMAGSFSQVVAVPSGFGLLRGVAVDSNGNLWASDQATSHVEGFAPPFTISSTPFATLTNGITTPIGLSADGSGNLWVTSSGANTALQFTPPIVTGNMPAVTLATGVSNDQGVAVDATGTVWIANVGGGGTVLECPPPAGTIACTSFAVPNALWIAAYPAAFNP